MTITVDYSLEKSQEDLEAYARKCYASEESKQQWKSSQAALTIIGLIVYFIVFKHLPTITALLWIGGATLFTCLSIGLYYPIYVRRKVASYVEENASSSMYTITLGSEGIRYTKNGDSITYSWSSLRSVEDLTDGFVELNVLDSPWQIPSVAFTDSQHRALFLKTLEAGRKGETGSSWWTQSETSIIQS